MRGDPSKRGGPERSLRSHPIRPIAVACRQPAGCHRFSLVRNSALALTLFFAYQSFPPSDSSAAAIKIETRSAFAYFGQ